MSRVFRIVIHILLAFTIATMMLALIFLILTRDISVALGVCISIIGWWGWPLWLFDVATAIDLATAVLSSIAIPLSSSLLIGVLLSTIIVLSLNSTTYIAIATYYVIGTLYFAASGKAPDVPFAILLPIWLTLLLVGVVISNKVLKRYT